MQVKGALREHRLVTIVGPGGAGKTRLALEAAYQTTRSYPGGSWFIDLGKLPAHRAIVDHVASALRLTRKTGQWTVAELAARLEHRNALLIIDTCEHVIDEVADLVQELLHSTRNVDVLATSRQALGVGGEQLVHLDGLEYPHELQPDYSPAHLAAIDSVVLFIERGRSIVPDFDLTPENASAVADIALRLEGLPLAIELAAARLRLLAPQQIASRLENQFRLLGSSRVATQRHQTLRATIEWSYDLCSRVERLCWARLSTFPADFDINAAESVACGGDIEPDAVLELVGALIDKSILRTTLRRGDQTRYRFTDPVREFGRDKLAELEPNGVARSRHLEHFSQMANYVPELLFGPSQVERTNTLRTERPNLEVALIRAVAEGEMDAADSLACAIALVSFASGSLSESFEALNMVAKHKGNRSTARVRVLWLSAWLAINQGDLDLARQRAAECRRLAQLIDDQQGIVHALQYLGECELLGNDSSAAEGHCRRALQLARELNQDHLIATALVRYAQVLAALDDPKEARSALLEAVAISDRVGEKWCRGFALWNLALLMQATGHPEEGVKSARAAFDSKALFEDVVGIAQGLEVMAWCSADLDEVGRAAVLLGAADSVWTSSGAVLPARLEHRRQDCERRVGTELGVADYLSLRREGQTLAPDDAVTWTWEPGDRDGSSMAPGSRAVEGTDRNRRGTGMPPLTAREKEVALLVAEGLKNREIAERLVISRRTAEAHVEHIRAKLGVSSRAQISSWAAYQLDD
ncbi:LuxR C-terminal-related transcriptional regulator (plasmid) [Rhodococcus opacus]|uniref:ATP-binding protein n=1 Tax=Rhodococcus opacus TaxID=37919 RepID=UPI0034D26005